MKRVIVASTHTPNPFKMDTTTSYYNNFLNENDLKYMQDSKNRTGEVVMMSPTEYYEECANEIFEGTSVARLKLERKASPGLVDKYEADMTNGDKFPLCYLNYADNSQEGLHRMMAAGQAYGWNTKFPVLCVRVFDEGRHRKYLKQQERQYFERYDLSHICEDAESELRDWDKRVPENVMHLFEEAIIKEAKQQTGHDIQVECELSEKENSLGRITVYLTSYDGDELPTYSGSYTTWIQDMFETEGTMWQPGTEPKKKSDSLDDDLNLLFLDSLDDDLNLLFLD